jgi:hypothetical protein
MEDVGVMQGGRRGAVGQREVVAGQPAAVVASGELAVQRGVGEVEDAVGLGDAVRVLGVGGSQRVADDPLHRRGDVVVGHAIPQSGLQRLVRVGGDQRRRVAVAIEVLDDDRRLRYHDAVVDQNWDQGRWPQSRERGAVGLDELGREQHIALIKGDQRLPAVHRKWMLVQDEAHAGTSPARKAASPSSSRPVPCSRSAGS